MNIDQEAWKMLVRKVDVTAEDVKKILAFQNKTMGFIIFLNLVIPGIVSLLVVWASKHL